MLALRCRLADEKGAGSAYPCTGDGVRFCWSGNDGRADASEMDARRNDGRLRPCCCETAYGGGCWAGDRAAGDGSEMPVIDCDAACSVWIDGSRWSKTDPRSSWGDGSADVWAVENAAPADDDVDLPTESNDEPVDSVGRTAAGGDEWGVMSMKPRSRMTSRSKPQSRPVSVHHEATLGSALRLPCAFHLDAIW